MDGKSLNITEDKKAQLKQLFPEVFAEDKIDFEKLKQVLGEESLAGSERYELSWAGKSEAFTEIQKQTTATLIPDKANSINFDTTENIFIEGENLEVLRALQKSYYGKVKMIYIDPPYNTGNDSFVYPDDYSEGRDEYEKRTGIKDEEGFLNKEDLWKKNTKENGQFHSVWLSMMYPRLFLAKNLLKEDGVIFVSIDDNEATNLKMLLDQIFGIENFVGQLIWKSRQNKDNRNITGLSNDHEYVLCYSKRNGERVLLGTERKTEQYSNPDKDKRGPWVSGNMVGLLPESQRPNCHYDLVNPATKIDYGKPKMGWRYDKKTMKRLISEDRILWPSEETGRPRRKVFLSDVSETKPNYTSIVGKDIYTRNGTAELDLLFDTKYFDFPKPTKLIKEFIGQIISEEQDYIILDFFSGSASTAHAILDLNKEDGGNRKFICVQMPEPTPEDSEARKAGYETISQIAQDRIKKVIEKIKKEEPITAQTMDLGFKSFSLQPSNFKTWRNDITGKELSEQIEAFTNPYKEAPEASGEENMLYEIILKAGLPLTIPIKETKVGKGILYEIDNGRLIIALHSLNQELLSKVQELKPQRFVTLDKLFKKQDELLTNTRLQLQEAEIDFQII